MIVLDSSAVLELLLATPVGRQLAERLRSPSVSLHTPHLVDVEVAQAVRRYVLAGSVPEKRGRLMLEYLSQLDLERYPHELLLPRIWGLRQNFTAYDAAYVALAEILEATLVAADRRLAAAPESGAEIELI